MLRESRGASGRVAAPLRTDAAVGFVMALVVWLQMCDYDLHSVKSRPAKIADKQKRTHSDHHAGPEVKSRSLVDLEPKIRTYRIRLGTSESVRCPAISRQRKIVCPSPHLGKGIGLLHVGLRGFGTRPQRRLSVQRVIEELSPADPRPKSGARSDRPEIQAHRDGPRPCLC